MSPIGGPRWMAEALLARVAFLPFLILLSLALVHFCRVLDEAGAESDMRKGPQTSSSVPHAAVPLFPFLIDLAA